MAKSTSTMVRHALFMMAGTFTSRILGLVREIITAAWFGASGILDAFNVAFTLANLARQLLAEGALSASFVPVFSRVLASRGRAAAEKLARQAFSVLLVAGVLAVGAGIIVSPVLVRIMAPGFDPVKTTLAISLTRWMFPFLLMVSMAALAMGVLNSLGSFLTPALAPALSNVIYIIMVILFASSWGVWGLAAAVLAGGFCQFGLQWGWTRKMGILLSPERPDLHDPDLRKMLSLFLPYAAGLSLNQVNPVLSRMLASFLQEGAISVMNYANRVIQLPLGLFVIAISQAVLPQLSRCASGDVEEFREIMRDSLRFALFVILPVTLGSVLISREVIHLLFVRGAFGQWAWEGTARSLSMYSLGLPGMACSTVVMRGLYARSLPRAALKVTFSSVAATLLFSLVLMGPMSYGGLALATSLSFTLSGAVGVYLLAGNLGVRLGIFSVQWCAKMAGSLLATAGTVLAFTSMMPYPAGEGIAFRSFWVFAVFFSSSLVYGVFTWLLGFQEWRWIRGAVGRKHGSSGIKGEGEE
ncbi:murein biosynthesis integral membrane protein MurJ [Aminivibrio sp.]|uniref:murein biosynthesis integral membrane protein MurJ n=1 Tax=Aminivibrio sp. TaxID=1872489 RepID=UPI001D69F979|nr:murein biosynthesis integral membrane protein MurJ [Synergistales bacterium]